MGEAAEVMRPNFSTREWVGEEGDSVIIEYGYKFRPVIE